MTILRDAGLLRARRRRESLRGRIAQEERDVEKHSTEGGARRSCWWWHFSSLNRPDRFSLSTELVFAWTCCSFGIVNALFAPPGTLRGSVPSPLPPRSRRSCGPGFSDGRDLLPGWCGRRHSWSPGHLPARHDADSPASHRESDAAPPRARIALAAVIGAVALASLAYRLLVVQRTPANGGALRRHSGASGHRRGLRRLAAVRDRASPARRSPSDCSCR